MVLLSSCVTAKLFSPDLHISSTFGERWHNGRAAPSLGLSSVCQLLGTPAPSSVSIVPSAVWWGGGGSGVVYAARGAPLLPSAVTFILYMLNLWLSKRPAHCTCPIHGQQQQSLSRADSALRTARLPGHGRRPMQAALGASPLTNIRFQGPPEPLLSTRLTSHHRPDILSRTS